MKEITLVESSNCAGQPYRLIDFILVACGIFSMFQVAQQGLNLVKKAEADRFPLVVEKGPDPARELFVFDEPYVPETFELMSMDPDDLFDSCEQPQLLAKPDPKPNFYSGIKVNRGVVREGEGMKAALERYGLDRHVLDPVIQELGKAFDVRHCRPGEHFDLYRDSEGHFRSLVWHRSPFAIYEVCSGYMEPDRFVLIRQPVVVEKETVKVSGTIGSGLMDSFSAYGLSPRLAKQFSSIFASQIDFNTEARIGDSFSLIFEKYLKDNELVGYGRIIAARYCRLEGMCLEAYYNGEGDSKSKGYYTPDGRALARRFLKTPLKVYRITSRFTSRRFHPILKVFRPHYGVDLAAPIGTPVMAVADGTVDFTGWQRGYGRIVILEHEGGYKTYYGHLSRFGKGIRKGSRVTRRQIIGYVGRSGYATGPHLDYRIRKNGRFLNPLGSRFQAGERLPTDIRKQFLTKVQHLRSMLHGSDENRILSVETKTTYDRPDGCRG